MFIPIIDYTFGKSLPQDIFLVCVLWGMASYLVAVLFFFMTSLLYKDIKGWLRKIRVICITLSPIGIVILGIALPLVVVYVFVTSFCRWFYEEMTEYERLK